MSGAASDSGSLISVLRVGNVIIGPFMLSFCPVFGGSMYAPRIAPAKGEVNEGAP